MKKKSITVLTAAILLMSSTPVFAASGTCSADLSNLSNFSCASLTESCNNYLTNLKSTLSSSNCVISSDCNASDSLKAYLESCGITAGDTTVEDLTVADDAIDCTGSDCSVTDDATDCTGSDCAANDATDCTGPDCAVTTDDTTDCTGPDCAVTDDTADTDVVTDNGSDITDITDIINNNTDTTDVVNDNTDTTDVVNDNTDTTDVVNDNTNTNTAVAESQYISEVIRLVNVERAKEGLSALSTNSTIQAAAQVRAQEIVTSFAHTRPDGSSCFTALDQGGVSYSGAGENIAYGQPTPAAVVDAWMNSPGHRANIMNASFTTIGVGCYNSGGTYYWSQFFTY